VSLEDDQIRRALSPDPHPYTAHSALRAIGPSMQRARWRRKFASRATGLVLLVGAGAGAMALTSSPTSPVTPAVSSDATLPPPATTTSTPSAEPALPTENASALVEDVVEPAAPPEPTTSVPDPSGDDDIATAPPIEPPTSAAPAVTTTMSTQPPVPAPPVAPETPTATPTPSATTQTIASACGDVVLAIDAGTVRIVSIAPRPGYVERVGDDGPTSIEVRFSGGGDNSCEVHAELKSTGLDVEVQNPR
jgi:hypothetical protein